MSSPVFISYRRQDSQHATGRLFQHLAPRYLAEAEIFMDVEAIAAGADFEAALDRQLQGCKVCLVMIGPEWLKPSADGRRRIDDPSDFVRLEVAAALARDITVIPVLLDQTAMPRETDLPEPLKPLAKRNAVRLTHERFEADADALAVRMLGVLGRSVDLEQDLLKLFFSFKGTVGRKQFWLGCITVFLLWLAVAAGVSSALGYSIGQFLAEPDSLPKDVKQIQQIATVWVWWPWLALAWKRIRDLGHGWDFFTPMLLTSVLAVGLDLMGYSNESGTLALIYVLLLVVIGFLKGTRFVAHQA